MEKQYPEKVLLIYEAVGKLICEGKDLSKIKVSDITNTAGIGKGTAYEYFSNKDEMISRAMMYHVELLMRNIIRGLSDCKTVDEQLEFIVQLANKNAFSALVYSSFKSHIIKSSIDELQKKIDCMNRIREGMLIEMADVLLLKAEEERLIKPVTDRTYARIVVVAAVCYIYEATVSHNQTDVLIAYMKRMITSSLQ